MHVPHATPIARTQIEQLSKFALFERKLQGNAALARAQLEIAMRAQRGAQDSGSAVSAQCELFL